ncbi:hypothetical protein Tco_0585925, partial [Tanacetum coccineum]
MDPMNSLGQKNTLAEYMILSGADNRPPMLDKDLYDSWKSRMELYMQNREHGRMILESVENAAEKNQADCYMKATNIILQGLPTDIYSLVNHHRVAKDLWERVQLLMQGTSLTKQERECKLYDAFDKFTHIKGESLHTYYLRFTQLINDMNIYKMKMEQFQVNTKFLNSLPPEWSKFVTDVKLVKDLHTSNFDQLHAYLEQHELHANEVRIMRERNQDPLAFVAYQSPQTPTQLITESPFVDSSFVVPVFSPGDDLIACPNKAMAFLTAVASSREDKGKIILVILIRAMLLVQGEILQVDRKELLNATTAKVKDIWLGNALNQSDQGMQHDYDDLSTAQAVLMANISNYGSDVILEVPNSETYLNDMDNESVYALQDFEQSPVMDFTDNEISMDVPSELPKKRTTPSALEEGEWGFKHTKAVFNNEIIPFLKSLKDIFNVFDKYLLNEITEVQTVFDQMEASVQQFSVDKKCLEIAKKEIILENDRLLQKVMSQDVLITVMNSMSLNNDSVNVKMQKCELCEKCLNLDSELSKSKQAYNDLLKNHSQLEKHCISLEVSMQLKQEVFQNDESCINQNAVELQEYFEINNLKARLQDKDTTISRLKDTIKSLKKNTKEKNVNHDKCDLEPINEELENRKEIIENVVHIPSATTIAPGMFKLDLVPLPPRIQKLLVYVQDTCPNAITPSTKKVVVTPMNNVKKVRLDEPFTSSSNIKQ